MKKLIAPLLILSFSCVSNMVWAEEDKPLSDTMKEEKKFIENKRQEAEKGIKAAKVVEDSDSIAIWENLDGVLEAKSRCFKESEEVGIRICISKVMKKLSEEGNFVAQDNLAKIYLSGENDEMALKWFNATIKNPKTPISYKYSVLDDVEKLEEKLKGKESKDEKPLSDSIKQEIKEVNDLKESTQKQKRKATILEDKDTLVLMKELEETVDSQTKCFQEKEEHDIRVCMTQEIKSLADKGNFFAQHMLGNLYENAFDNKAMAIKWYKKALENPKMPKTYVPQIQSDLNRAQADTKKAN